MLSTAGDILITVGVLLTGASVGWIIFTQLRARKLGVGFNLPPPSLAPSLFLGLRPPCWDPVGRVGRRARTNSMLLYGLQLPPPSLSSYLSWRRSDNSYGTPRPASGGVVGWIKDRVRDFKKRNQRSAVGAYESSLHGAPGRGRGAFGPLDPDEAWDARVGNEADGYGDYEEQELDGAATPLAGRTTHYGGAAAYDLSLGQPSEPERGRAPTRTPSGVVSGKRNPFDDDAASSLRGLSPRPIDPDEAENNGRAEGEFEAASGRNSPAKKKAAAPREESI